MSILFLRKGSFSQYAWEGISSSRREPGTGPCVSWALSLQAPAPLQLPLCTWAAHLPFCDLRTDTQNRTQKSQWCGLCWEVTLATTGQGKGVARRWIKRPSGFLPQSSYGRSILIKGLHGSYSHVYYFQLRVKKMALSVFNALQHRHTHTDTDTYRYTHTHPSNTKLWHSLLHVFLCSLPPHPQSHHASNCLKSPWWVRTDGYFYKNHHPPWQPIYCTFKLPFLNEEKESLKSWQY